MDTYKCEICGKEHKIFKAVEAPAPEMITEIPEEEQAKRVKQIKGSYIIDDAVFLIRGDIFIYKKGEDKPYFIWSVWASFPLEKFKSKAEALQRGDNVEFAGVLESELPFYEQTKGLKLKIIININYEYAVLKIEEDSPLQVDQRDKITRDRVFEIMGKVHHQPA